LENFSKFETPVAYHFSVLLFIGGQSFDPLLRGGGRSMLDESPKELSAGDGHDIDVVSKNGEISGRDGERNLGKSRIKRFNVNDGILLVVKSESTQQTVNFDIRVAWPDTDVVTVLVVDTGTLDTKFHMDTVSISSNLEELTSNGDGSREGVLGIVDALGPCQSTSRKLTCKVYISI
jgi:hypothetical protein